MSSWHGDPLRTGTTLPLPPKSIIVSQKYTFYSISTNADKNHCKTCWQIRQTSTFYTAKHITS